MIYLKIQGGLGNQLYQMFFGYELSRILKREIIFDFTRLTDGWENLSEEQKHRSLALTLYGSLSNKFKTFSHSGWEKEEDFHFFLEPRVSDTENYIDFWTNIKDKIEELKSIDLDKIIYVDGHWQSYSYDNNQIRYFRSYLNNVKSSDSKIKYDIHNSEISCCINVRRGDYITHHKGFFHECTMENYFNKAISDLDSRFENKKVQYFIFTDQLDWCRENFKGDNMTIVDHSYSGEKFTEYLDLMRMCDHYIIPNSTFAIWAAITSHNTINSIVYAPDKWYVSNSKVPNPLTNSIAQFVTEKWQIIES